MTWDNRVMPEHGEWMTYAELAERFGISRDAAKMLARRKSWQRKPSNSRGGVVRVLVPPNPEHRNAWNGRNDPEPVSVVRSGVPADVMGVVPPTTEPMVPLGRVLAMVSEAVSQERADRDRQIAHERAETARRLAERDSLHLGHIERLLAQAGIERSLWLERVDAAEVRAERVEQRLDQVLDQLLADRRQPAVGQVEQVERAPWWRRWFGRSMKSDLGRG